MSPLVKLAHESIDAYVKEGRIMPLPETLSPGMQAQAGVFVSIHKDDELRGLHRHLLAPRGATWRRR